MRRTPCRGCSGTKPRKAATVTATGTAAGLCDCRAGLSGGPAKTLARRQRREQHSTAQHSTAEGRLRARASDVSPASCPPIRAVFSAAAALRIPILQTGSVAMRSPSRVGPICASSSPHDVRHTGPMPLRGAKRGGGGGARGVGCHSRLSPPPDRPHIASLTPPPLLFFQRPPPPLLLVPQNASSSSAPLVASPRQVRVYLSCSVGTPCSRASPFRPALSYPPMALVLASLPVLSHTTHHRQSDLSPARRCSCV